METIMVNADKLSQKTLSGLPADSLQLPEKEPQPVQLTVNDLQLLARIIDLASRRGAFQAVELADIGTAFNKLTGFLAWVENEEKKKEAAK